MLQERGFTKNDEGWTLEEKEYSLKVTQTDEAAEAGTLRIFTISGTGDGADLFSLPSTRYIPKEVSP